MKYNRIKRNTNKYTFKEKAIANLIKSYKEKFQGIWIDSFAGQSTIADIRNDIEPSCVKEFGHQYNLNYVDFFNQMICKNIDVVGVILDPPFSDYQASTRYLSGTQNKLNFTAACKKDDRNYKNIMKYYEHSWYSIKKLQPKVVVQLGFHTFEPKGWKVIEILAVNHKIVCNDTIVSILIPKI